MNAPDQGAATPTFTPEQIEGGYLKLMEHMQMCLNTIGQFRSLGPAVGDARGLSVAATHLETAMLWLANARPEMQEALSEAGAPRIVHP